MTVAELPERVFMTRLILNGANRFAQRDVKTIGYAHRAVQEMFPDLMGWGNRSTWNILYRMVTDSRIGHHILVQSTYRPDPTPLLEQGYAVEAEVKDWTPMLESILRGRRVEYLIAASSRITAGQRTSRRRAERRPARTAHEMDTWWENRDIGLDIRINNAYRPYPRQVSRFSENGFHILYQIKGHAVITDPHKLKHAIINGIGPGKSHGGGLLTIRYMQ